MYKWDVATTHVLFIATYHGNPYVGSELLGLCETDATHRHHVPSYTYSVQQERRIKMNSVPLEHTCIKTGGSMVIGTVQFIMAKDIMRCVLETQAVMTKASDFLIHMMRTDKWQLINPLICFLSYTNSISFQMRYAF